MLKDQKGFTISVLRPLYVKVQNMPPSPLKTHGMVRKWQFP